MVPIPDDMRDLSAAEDFFHALDLPFDEQVVRVNRLHILKRYTDYLSSKAGEGLDDAAVRALHRDALAQAHADFAASDAVTERVFKVFQEVKGTTFMSMDSIEPLADH